jgi:CubicO group peptidase (beta-lactamase class C family)
MSDSITGESYPTAGWPVQPIALDRPHRASLKDLVSQQFPMVEALVVIQHGALVYEHYVRDLQPGDTVELLSITKSITSVLIGMMLHEGLLDSLDQNLADILPDYYTRLAAPLARQITIRHLLTMTSGFEWDFHNRDRQFWRLRHLEDVLNGPMSHQPGAVFSYDDCNVQLLSHVINRITGFSAAECAEPLFELMGIANHPWTVDEWGFANCSGGLSLAPRDLAKFAYLFLTDGCWEGERLLSPEFVQEAISVQSAGGYPAGTGYGFLWWVWNARGYPAFYGLGQGGRIVFAVPEQELIAVVTTDETLGMDDINLTRRLISEVIIPALPAERAG